MKQEGEPFERLENCETGDICSKSGRYFCDMHPYIEKYVSKGERFPQCDQKGIPHKTSWNKLE